MEFLGLLFSGLFYALKFLFLLIWPVLKWILIGLVVLYGVAFVYGFFFKNETKKNKKKK